MINTFKNYLHELLEQRKALRVFDFDDTLAHTDSAIGIMHDGVRIKDLSSLSFKNYVLKPGEEFDYSGANAIKNPKPIGAVLKILRSVLSQNKSAVVLTGRSDPSPVRDWLKQIGISIPVIAIGHSNASHASIAKAKYDCLVMMIRNGYNDIEFFDDNSLNLDYAKRIKKEFPGVRFGTRLIKYKAKGLMLATNEDRDYKAEYLKMYGGDDPTPKQRIAMKKKTARKRVLRRMGREGTSDDGREIDHKNGNALDGRPSNLRLVSRHTNRSKDNNKWRK